MCFICRLFCVMLFWQFMIKCVCCCCCVCACWCVVGCLLCVLFAFLFAVFCLIFFFMCFRLFCVYLVSGVCCCCCVFVFVGGSSVHCWMFEILLSLRVNDSTLVLPVCFHLVRLGLFCAHVLCICFLLCVLTVRGMCLFPVSDSVFGLFVCFRV